MEKKCWKNLFRKLYLAWRGKQKQKKEWRIKSEIIAAERREKERIEWEQAQRQEKELLHFKGLLQEAKR